MNFQVHVLVAVVSSSDCTNQSGDETIMAEDTLAELGYEFMQCESVLVMPTPLGLNPDDEIRSGR